MEIQSRITGLVDRRIFVELLDFEFKRCRRYHHFVSLLLLDWQTAGSSGPGLSKTAWVRQVAPLLKERTREADLMSAFQAGVIGVLLPHTNGEEALIVGQRLSDWANECLSPAYYPKFCDIRIGVASYPSRAMTVEDMFLEAIRTLCCHTNHDGALHSSRGYSHAKPDFWGNLL